MSKATDIAIIGGGIAGISAGAALAEQANVTVLEGEAQLGYHSTGRSAAVFILNYGNDTLRALNRLAFPALDGALLGQSVLSARGELMLADEDSLDALDAHLSSTETVRRMTPQEALDLVPVLRPDSFVAAAYEDCAMGIDVDFLLQGCARQLRQRGGVIELNTRVTGIERQGDGWLIRTDKEDISAGIVINAAGAWADQIAKLAGVRPIGLQPMRRSAVLMPLPETITNHVDWPLLVSMREDWYAKPEATGLMISPADEDPVDPQDAWPDDLVLAEGLHRFEQMVDVPLVRPIHTWAGLRSFVADRSPVCGFDPDAKGFYWLAAQGGYGVQTSPALAELTRALCLGGDLTCSDTLVDALSPVRLR